jgi:enoyl-CoA hydratase
MIERSDAGGVTVLRLAHGKAHALDLELCLALTGELEALAESRAPAVLTGAGAIFSAGVDLVRLLREPVDYTPGFLQALTGCFLTLFDHPAPVVAAINGHAVAGGCILALACDRRVAAEGDYGIGIPELRVGVPFPVIALEIVRDAAPGGHFRDDLVYQGEVVPPAEALARGLVDELVPAGELLGRAIAAARRLGSIPRTSFATTKRALRAPALERYRLAAPAADAEIVEAWCAPEVRDAVAAHVERTLGKRGGSADR